MSNLSKTAVSKLQAIKEANELRNAKNRAASRKSRAKTAAKNAGVSYADYVKSTYGVTIAVYESLEYKSSTRGANGSVPTKGTDAWHEYNRIATRRSKMRKVLEVVEIIDPANSSLDMFVSQYTNASTADEFLSDKYAGDNPKCYTIAHYKSIADALANA